MSASGDPSELAEPVLSRAALDQIRSIGANGHELLKQVGQSFLRSSRELIEEIHAAAEAADIELLVRAAHTLKSCSGNLGATQVVELSARIEAAGKSGALDEATPLIPELDRAHLAACIAVEHEIA